MEAQKDPMKQQVLQILAGLESLAIQYTNMLQVLCLIAFPQVQDKFYPIVKEMIDLKHSLPNASTQQIASFLQANIPTSPIHVKLYLSLRELGVLLSLPTPLQLMHLSNNVIPPGPLEFQAGFLLKLQEIFQGWGREVVKDRHTVISSTPVHMETQQLLQLEPKLPWDILHVLVELLKMPLPHVEHMHEWFSQLQKPQIEKLVLLLTRFRTVELIEIKKYIGVPLPNITRMTVANVFKHIGRNL